MSHEGAARLVEALQTRYTAMKAPSAMPEFLQSTQAPPLDAAHCNNSRDKGLLGLVLITLVRTSEALAGEQAIGASESVNPNLDSFRLTSPTAVSMPLTAPVITAPAVSDNQVFL